MNDTEQELPLGLYWKGKRTTVDRIVLPFQSLEVIETINESRATREKEKGTMFRSSPSLSEIDWRNKLIWGDNKLAMSALVGQFANKIDLIYIDPPFATGADFSTTVTIGDSDFEHTKESSAIEEVAYRDTWGRGLDSFLQMLYDRLVLMRELLNSKGCIFVHVDYRTNSYVRCLLDEIFGISNFRNEIYVKRKTKNLQTQFDKVKQLNIAFDSVFWYSKSPEVRFPVPKKENRAEVNTEQWNNFYNNADRPTLRYPLLGINLTDGQWRWSKDRALRAVENYVEWKEKYSSSQTLYEYWLATGETKEFIKREKGATRCYYWIPPKGEINVDTNWSDFYAYDNSPGSYPTQKSEELMFRLIENTTSEGDLVADFFMGGGTTIAAAEKLNRRWIGCDLGRFALHHSRKRLLDIDNCGPFEILNIGKYERHNWQTFNFGSKSEEQTFGEYIAFILRLYKADPLPGSSNIHGKRGAKLIHIGSVDAPVTFSEIQNALDEVRRMRQKDLVVLGWEWEMGLHDVVEQEAMKAGINLSLLNIPREVTDKRAVDAGDVQFFELAYLETETKKTKSSEYVIQLTDFVIPNLDLIPEEVKKLIKKWSDYIDYWSVDWNYKNDTFHNQWQSYRTKKDRTLELKTDPHEYPARGVYKVMIKVIDIFGNDTTRLVEIKH